MDATERYRDASLLPAERAADLVPRMTLDEKLAQLGCIWVTQFVTDGRFDPDRAAEKLEHGIGHVTRIGSSTGLHPDGSAYLLNEIQRVAVEGTRLGIPVVVHEESTGGFCARDATVFPQGIGLASTWDPELVETVAGVIREQMLAVGARHTLAPVLDVARDPRWGRVEETYGEDPHLCGTIGTAYVRGLQTDDLAHGVVATGKHFLGYALSEGGLNHAPVHLGPRELREVYAEPFAAAIRDAGLASMMNSYSSVDGLPCAGSPSILDTLLRDELGFAGVVVADYGAVSLLVSHHRTAATKGEAAAQALRAPGMDMELPRLDCFGEPLRELIEAGDVDMAFVDRAVLRLLTVKFALGVFEQPYVDVSRATAVFQTQGQRALTRRAAVESLVLLKNEGELLPLDPLPGRIAVVGPAADDQRLLQGDYHYPAHLELGFERSRSMPSVDFLPDGGGGTFATAPHYTPHVTPLAGLRAAIGDRAAIEYAPGCEVSGDDRSGIDEAVRVTRRADVAIVCVGGRSGLMPDSTVGEGRDSSDLGLTGVQQELVEAVHATGTPTVVLVMSGRVHALPWIVESIPAVLLAWPLGEEGGAAVASVLLGDDEPGGRLPVSLPRSVGHVPSYDGPRAGGGRAAFSGDYTDSPAGPLLPFGHGLGYTTFAYAPLNIEASDTDAPVVVSITVTNTGARSGTEVVQLFARDDVASVARPERQLVGFARVSCEPDQSRTVTFTVHPSKLSFYDQSMRFVTEPGSFTFTSGGQQASATLAGAVREYKQRAIVATEVTL